MGLSTAEALCECNATSAPSHQTLECYISAKDLLPTCKPILKASVKAKCGVRRMIISTFILLLIFVVTYFLSTSGQRLRTLGESLRRRIQSAPEQVTPQSPPSPPVEGEQAEEEQEEEEPVEAVEEQQEG